jgi:hypothetical protein
MTSSKSLIVSTYRPAYEAARVVVGNPGGRIQFSTPRERLIEDCKRRKPLDCGKIGNGYFQPLCGSNEQENENREI